MTTPTVYIDDRLFREKIRKMKANQPEAGRAMVVELVDLAADGLLQFSAPFNDTNRYYNGWADAATKAGSPRAMLPLEKPKRYADIRARLQRQHDVSRDIFKFWSKRVAGIEARGGNYAKWKSYKQAKKKLSKAVDVFDRAIENLEHFQETGGVGAINFAGKYGGAQRTGLSLAALDRTIHKVYGGSGRVFNIGPKWLAELRNAEPHAKLVERKHRVISRTKARLRKLGARSASQKYLDSLTAGTAVRRAA